MKTLTATRPARKPASDTKPTGRLFRWLYRHPGQQLKGAIRIVMCYANRSEMFRYWVEALPSDFGTAYTLTKITPDGKDDEVYHVCVDNPQDSLCTCKGFESHGHCKHLSACQVIASGK
jgi:hypothetical protein